MKLNFQMIAFFGCALISKVWSQQNPEIPQKNPGPETLLYEQKKHGNSKPETLLYRLEDHYKEAFLNPLDRRNDLKKLGVLSPDKKIDKIISDLEACSPAKINKKLTDEINAYRQNYNLIYALNLPANGQKLSDEEISRKAKDDLLKFELNLKKKVNDLSKIEDQNQDFFKKFDQSLQDSLK